MKSAIIKMFIVFALLSVQASGSFASAQMPCNDDMAAQMNHASHDMLEHSQNTDMNECCDQDCCCPMAMFHIGLLSGHTDSSQSGVSQSIPSLNPNLHQVFLGALQRPPKPSLV